MSPINFDDESKLPEAVLRTRDQEAIFQWQQTIDLSLYQLQLKFGLTDESLQQMIAQPETLVALDKLEQAHIQSPENFSVCFRDLFQTNPLLAIAAFQLKINNMCHEDGYRNR
jgi:hypothetical protein